MRYNSPSPSNQFREYFLRGGIPVTLIILACNVLVFLATFFARDAATAFVASYLVFDSATAVHAPWTFITYPLVSVGFSIMLVVTWVFFWLSGGSLERSWGSRRFAIFFVAVSALSAASLLLGSLLLHTVLPPLNDLFLPLTALIVAFCMLNPTQTLTLYFFPIQARWVALIVTGFVFFQYGEALGPQLGFFSLGGILASVLYMRFGRSWADVGYYTRPRPGPDLRIFPSSSGPRRKTALDGSRRRSIFDIRGRWRDFQERRRLERLLRNSGFSDNDSGWHDGDEQRPRGA